MHFVFRVPPRLQPLLKAIRVRGRKLKWSNGAHPYWDEPEPN